LVNHWLTKAFCRSSIFVHVSGIFRTFGATREALIAPPAGQNPAIWRVAKKHHSQNFVDDKILIEFRPQSPVSISGIQIGRGKAYAFEIQTF
jgi:hypothetical protein